MLLLEFSIHLLVSFCYILPYNQNYLRRMIIAFLGLEQLSMTNYRRIQRDTKHDRNKILGSFGHVMVFWQEGPKSVSSDSSEKLFRRARRNSFSETPLKKLTFSRSKIMNWKYHQSIRRHRIRWDMCFFFIVGLTERSERLSISVMTVKNWSKC